MCLLCIETAKEKLQEKRTALEDKTFTAPVAKVEKADPTVSEFKKALLSVFSAYKESNFFSIKNGLRSSSNKRISSGAHMGSPG